MGDGAAGRRGEARARRRAVRRRRATLGAVAGATALLVAALAAGGDGTTAPRGARVAGTDVGGLGRAELERVVRARAAQLMDVPVVIQVSDPGSRFRTVVSRAALGARPRVDRAVDDAMRRPGVAGRLLGRLGLASGRDVRLRFRTDAARVAAVADRVAAEVDRPPVAAALAVRGRRIVLTPSRTGSGVARDALRRRIRALPRTVVIRRAALPPPIDDAAAARARELALRVVDAPVAVRLRERAAPLSTAALWEALRFHADAPELRVGLDPDVLHRAVAPALSGRERQARRARFLIAGDAVSVIPSRAGRRLGMPAVAAAIVNDPDAAGVPVRLRTVAPSRTTAEARALRITAKVSEFTTPYDCCAPRVTNIARAAEILDGTIIPAGGRFSLNEALGRRTKERGFVAAPQIAAGRLEDAVGGGVSQMATALFNGAFFAGLRIVAHTPHQFYIPRYPPGREATVSYGGPELVFVNDWDAGLLITAEAGDTALTVRFYSSPLGRRVETTADEPVDLVPPTTVELVDPELEPGAIVVEQAEGEPGFTIRYTRRVLREGRVHRDESYLWTYAPQNGYIVRGPEPEPVPAPEPQPADAPPPEDTAPAPPGPPRQQPRGDATGAATEATAGVAPALR